MLLDAAKKAIGKKVRHDAKKRPDAGWGVFFLIATAGGSRL